MNSNLIYSYTQLKKIEDVLLGNNQDIAADDLDEIKKTLTVLFPEEQFYPKKTICLDSDEDDVPIIKKKEGKNHSSRSSHHLKKANSLSLRSRDIVRTNGSCKKKTRGISANDDWLFL